MGQGEDAHSSEPRRRSRVAWGSLGAGDPPLLGRVTQGRNLEQVSAPGGLLWGGGRVLP